MDQQVKVRGYRIELGEIEALLNRHEQVREAVVVVKEGEGEKRLVGYLASETGEAISADELRSHLRQSLPDYMIPSVFVQMDKLPLTANGKIDRRALPEPEVRNEQRATECVAPRTAIDEMMASIWSDVLKIDGIGIHDNFFELGGHSILAMRLISRVRDVFQVELPVRCLFELPTVAQVGERVLAALQEGLKFEIPPIRVVDRNQQLPLSYAQQRLWFVNQLEPDSPFYGVPSAIRLSGQLKTTALEDCFNEIFRRHEALRTVFFMEDKNPVQIILPALETPLSVIDLRTIPSTERAAFARQLAIEEAGRPFNLSQGPLLRLMLLQLEDEERVLLLTIHHISTDAWSTGLLFGEVSRLYNAFAQGKESPLAELEIQYADYAVWQREWLQDDVLEHQLNYWKQQLADAPAVLDLPTDRSRPAVQSYRGAVVPFAFSQNLEERLKTLSQREGVTMFMTLLAAFQTLLSRYSGQEDVVVGTPIAGRNQGGVENLIGFFINTLVLRNKLSSRQTFRDLLRQTRDVALGAYANQEVPFEKLVEEVQPERSLSHQPLFQVVFSLQNIPGDGLVLEGLTLTRFRQGAGIARFDITMTMAETGQGLPGTLEYSTDLFDEATIKRMLGHFNILLENLVTNPDTPIARLRMLPQEEAEQILFKWNDTGVDYSRDVFAHHLFEAQVERTPDATALVYEDCSLTYRELNCSANQLAHHLIGVGVKPEVMVGLCVERRIEMVVGLLAVLKAGAAYLPLDPTNPAERLSFMLQDADVAVLLTQESLLDSFASHWGQTICLDADWPQIAEQQSSNPGLAIDGDQLAYMIYTSGSTGKPKGAMITHAGLANYLNWATAAYAAGAGRGSLLHSSIAFDLTVTSLYPALLSGGVVELVSEASGIEGLAAALQRGGDYSLLKITPAHLQVLNRLLSGTQKRGLARALVIGGEALPGEALREWQEQAPETRLINEYGPTETVVGSSIYEVRAGERVSGVVWIGRGIGNTQIYVLDEGMELAAVGVAGEIYIGGAGVSRGYWKRAEQTAERMVANEYGEGRLYRTGDVGRWNSAGELEYVGRKDEQVKVRGYRIELGEVEVVLKEMEGVSEAAVMAKEDGSGSVRLVAYVGSKQGVEVRRLREYMEERLPEYMTPSAYVVMEELPLTVNGKVDRKALPEPEGSIEETGEDYVAPRTAVEEMLAGIWVEVLDIDDVGVEANFFELGGQSLLAMILMSRVCDVFGVDLPLRTLFEHPTVAGLSRVIIDMLVEQEGSDSVAQFLDELEDA
jgi:amino acid adenylation domain-containing protein